MTAAWRAARAPYADLSGEGARLAGGRWNSRGVPVVYLADHPAAALLEVRVHLDLPPDLLPRDYLLLEVELGDLRAERLDAMPDDPRAAGDAWAASLRSPLLSVPSAIVPVARNLLLNPRHPAAARARIVATHRLPLDPRLWGGGAPG